MRVYEAVVIAQVVYGLDSVYLTPAVKRTIDGFHATGLRHLLGIDHPLWSRVSNEEVFQEANEVLEQGREKKLEWEQFLQIGREEKRGRGSYQ